MSNRKFHVYIEKDRGTGLFAVRCLEMSVFSQGRTEDEALRNVKEAIEEASRGKKKLIEVEV